MRLLDLPGADPWIVCETAMSREVQQDEVTFAESRGGPGPMSRQQELEVVSPGRTPVLLYIPPRLSYPLFPLTHHNHRLFAS